MADRVETSRATPTLATPEGSELDEAETTWKFRLKYKTKSTEGASSAAAEKESTAASSREKVDDVEKAPTPVPVAARQRRKDDAERAKSALSAPAAGQEEIEDVAKASTAVAAAAAAGAVAARIVGRRVAVQDEVQAVQQRGCSSEPSVVWLMAAAGLLVVFYLLLRPGSKGSR